MPNKDKRTAGQWLAAILMMLGLVAAIAWRYIWPYPPVYIALVFAALLAAGLIAVKLSGGRTGTHGMSAPDGGDDMKRRDSTGSSTSGEDPTDGSG